MIRPWPPSPSGWRRRGRAGELSTAAPVVFFGTGLPEDHWHDSNERVSVDVLLAGAATLAAFWDQLPSI
jgi:hypothetical protein